MCGFLLGAVRGGLAPEQQIAGKQFAPVNVAVLIEYSHILPDPCLLRGVARKKHPIGEIDTAGESAAVHVLDGRASPHVRNSEEPITGLKKILPETILVRSPVLAVVSPFVEHSDILGRNIPGLAGRKHDTRELPLHYCPAFSVAAAARLCAVQDSNDVSEHKIRDDPRLHRRLLVDVGVSGSTDVFRGSKIFFEIYFIHRDKPDFVDPGRVRLRAFDLYPVAGLVQNLDDSPHQRLVSKLCGIVRSLPHEIGGKLNHRPLLPGLLS